MLAWGLHLGLRPLSDNSFLTHLATGRMILRTGRVPTADPYSFTEPDAAWVVQSWLASAVYGTAERLFGAAGLVGLHGLLFVAVAVLVVVLTARAESLIPRLGLCALAMAVGSGLWSERPLMFGLVLFGLTLVVAERRLDPRVLLVAFALWVNLHGSFPLGLVLLGCLAVGAALDRASTDHELRCLGWAVAGVLLGSVNPLGPRLLQFPLELLSRSEVLIGVIEWKAPSFQSNPERAWLVQVVLAVVLLVRRPSYRTAIPLCVFTAAGLLASRNIPVASLVLLLGMAAATGDLGSISVRSRSAAASVLTAALVAASAAVVLVAAERPAFDLRAYPAAQLALAEAVVGEDARIVAPDFVGNYRTAISGPGAGVFYDDRFDMYSAALAEDHRTLHRGSTGWAEVLREHADAVIWEVDTPLAALLAVSGEWRIVGADDTWVLAVPRAPAADR